MKDILDEKENMFNLESLNYILANKEEAKKYSDTIFKFFSTMNKSRYIKTDDMKNKYDESLSDACEAVRKLNELALQEKINPIIDPEKQSCYLCLKNYYDYLSYIARNEDIEE